MTVLDNENKALSGATVVLSVGVGPDQGNLTIGANTGKSVTGTTDVEGKVAAQYHAAMVDVVNGTQVIIDATATHPNFPDPASRSTIIRVFPPDVPFLSLRVDLPLGDRVTAGTELPVQITVKDQDRASVADADVNIAVDPPGALAPDPAGGTSAAMANVKLTAAGTVITEASYSVTITADKTTYASAEKEFEVTIVPSSGGGRYCEDGTWKPWTEECPVLSTPALDVLPILGAIGVAALVAGVVAERKRRS